MSDSPGKIERQVPAAPKCISLMLCESAFTVAGSTNQIIVNTFHTLGVPGCPSVFPKVTVLYTLTNGHGRYRLTVALTHAASGRPVVENRHDAELREPLHLMDGQVVLLNVPFPEPGKYWAEVRSDDELIGQRPFHVMVNDAPPIPLMAGPG